MNISEYLVTEMKNNQNIMNNLFIGLLIVKKKFPPKKNENKFIYGIVCQKLIINFLSEFLIGCNDLDKGEQNLYKNDMGFYFNEHLHLCSIKVCSKKSNIILINKNYNNINHNLSDLITLLFIIESREIIIIKHNDVYEKFINNNPSNISYKSSIITYFRKNLKGCIFNLNENEKFTSFIDKKINLINEIDYYSIIADDILKQI